ncbi:cytochrome c/c1 heme lyase-domain-containing protein [Lactarius psammicola]|nr:cytochrome c/c1 heme lyase-domain-containing protein [Lactarius psammicola]
MHQPLPPRNEEPATAEFLPGWQQPVNGRCEADRSNSPLGPPRCSSLPQPQGVSSDEAEKWKERNSRSWCIPGQGMFALREIDRRARNVLVSGVSSAIFNFDVIELRELAPSAIMASICLSSLTVCSEKVDFDGPNTWERNMDDLDLKAAIGKDEGRPVRVVEALRGDDPQGPRSQGADISVVVPIHTIVNERAWSHIQQWVAGHGGGGGGGYHLVSFKGKPAEPSPKARILTLLGYNSSFDRHDWVVEAAEPASVMRSISMLAVSCQAPPSTAGNPLACAPACL